MTDLFHEIPDNPVPEYANGGYLTATDGKRLRYACFSASARPIRGTVLLLTGRNECIEKYFETIRNLAERGFGVAILDWRGQGGSDRLLRNVERGYVKSFHDYARDLDHFFGEVLLPDCRGPYYVLAHSSGALIALLAAPSMVNRIRRMVLIAPFLALPGQPVSMKTLGRVARLLCWLGLGRLYVSGGPRARQKVSFETNKVTSDSARYRRNRLIYETFPRLALGGPTLRWLRGACEAAIAISKPDFMTANNIPILVVAAGADQVVSTKAVEDYARHLRLGGLVTIDGARHEILQEADLYREQFLAAFDAFIPGSDAETP
jgi:lysophospholipase